MADLVVTAANVINAGASVDTGNAGEVIAAGKAVYRDPTTKKFFLSDTNGTAAQKNVRGVALSGGAVNQPISVATAGPITLGATMVAGTAYFASDTPGGICTFADVGTGEESILIGVATSTTVLKIAILDSNVTL